MSDTILNINKALHAAETCQCCVLFFSKPTAFMINSVLATCMTIKSQDFLYGPHIYGILLSFYHCCHELNTPNNIFK